MTSNVPVSYTHLTRLVTADVVISAIRDILKLIDCSPLRSISITDTSSPVSYTHLDVYKRQAYWYTQALSSQPAEQTGAFVRKDCYGFLPAIQLCVCYDRLGDYRRAWHYHLKSQKLKPEHPSVRQNQTYFERILKHPAEGQSSAQ